MDKYFRWDRCEYDCYKYMFAKKLNTIIIGTLTLTPSLSKPGKCLAIPSVLWISGGSFFLFSAPITRNSISLRPKLTALKLCSWLLTCVCWIQDVTCSRYEVYNFNFQHVRKPCATLNICILITIVKLSNQLGVYLYTLIKWYVCCSHYVYE